MKLLGLIISIIGFALWAANIWKHSLSHGNKIAWIAIILMAGGLCLALYTT